jgi:hypothetical protein
MADWPPPAPEPTLMAGIGSTSGRHMGPVDPHPMFGGGGGAADLSGVQQRRKKNILYAVMALVGELEPDDLVYVRREVDERLSSTGR